MTRKELMNKRFAEAQEFYNKNIKALRERGYNLIPVNRTWEAFTKDAPLWQIVRLG